MKAGIEVSDQAKVKINNNFICMNDFQGIIIKENSNAKIMYNEIYKNIKANIALGGKKSSESLIINNKIYTGSSQGIYLCYSDKCKVYYNKIINNYIGILV